MSHPDARACDLCQAINPQVSRCSLQDQVGSGRARIVAASDAAAAVPTIGAFVPGYLLIVPRRHVLSLGQLPDRELQAVEKFTRLIADRLHRAYQMPVLAFEYGLNVQQGRRIPHGHLHLLPTSANLVEWLDERLPGHEIGALTRLPRTDGASYIAVSTGEGSTRCYPVANDASPRIRLREGVAQLDPRVRNDAWDWQDHPCPEVMRSTLDDLLGVAAVRAPSPRRGDDLGLDLVPPAAPARRS